MEELNLEEAGLTKNESKTYQTLVKFSKLTSTALSSKSGVPYGRIYDVLGSLTQKGLVKTIPGKTKQFTATDPEELVKIIEKKERSLSNVKQKAKELKKFYEQREDEVVQIAFGDKGFWKLANEVKNDGKFRYHIRWTSVVRPDSITGLKRDIKKGIVIKQLVRYDDETKKDVDKRHKYLKTIKQIENDGIALSIKDTGEVLIGLIKSNTTLLIKDKPFAKLMKGLFEAKYKLAKNIE